MRIFPTRPSSSICPRELRSRPSRSNYRPEISHMKTSTSADRLLYLDWLRGLGAVIMLQGHVFHSFLKPELRSGGAFMMSQFVGGMPPAIFLFLTGVTLAFLMDSTERKGLPPGTRYRAALRRAGYLFLLACAF